MVRDGYFYGISLLAVAALVWWGTGVWLWGMIPLILAAFFLWFFRDPERKIPEGQGLVVSPADGLLTSIDRIQTPRGEKLRLSVFLSVFDVHVNRAPVGGVLTGVRHQKGEFLNALNPESADKNEQNAVVVSGEAGEVTFKQIAGLLARRIVFTKREGDAVRRGERVGMIKFGSRVDILLPANATLRVAKGDRVKGGSSILAVLPLPSAVFPNLPAEEEVLV